MAAAVDRTTILIVEDDRELRDLYRGSLSAAGYMPIAVADGLDALRCIEQDTIPDAIVLDIGLPRVSGHDVHREIAANPATSHIPIVIVTGAEFAPIGLRRFDCVFEEAGVHRRAAPRRSQLRGAKLQQPSTAAFEVTANRILS